MFLFHLSGGRLNTEKEKLKSLNADYRSTGQLWYYHGKFHSWIEALDNEYMRQKLQWMTEDIKAGYSNFYYRELYLQQHIAQPWINELCLSHYSNDHMKNFYHTTISLSSDFPKAKEIIIPREQYQNIYDPIELDSLEMREKFGMYFYDQRVDDLNKQLLVDSRELFDEQLEFAEQLDQLARINWADTASTYMPLKADGNSLPNIIKKLGDQEDITGEEPWFQINYLTYSPDEYINLGKTYFEGFGYREELSDKSFKVFTKPIDDTYQWALMLFSSRGLLWDRCRPLLVIIKNIQNKPIKPKDVVYQELLLFFSDSISHPSSMKDLVLHIQRFNFINHYINRYIDWMQPKVMAVVYD